MPANHVLLETIELSQSAASVTFDNIPQTGYSGLKIVISARSTGSYTFATNQIAFNGSASGFSVRILGGTALTTLSLTDTVNVGPICGTSITANSFSNSEIYIPNYTSNNYKSYSWDTVLENNATSGRVYTGSGLWSNTAAITSITFTINGADPYSNYSTFSIYGIAATGTTPVTAPKAQGGNIVANDGTYWYHAFLSSGTFTPTIPLTCDYLVVAGGGGGGRDYYAGGGGGGGGLRSTVTATGGGGTLENAISLSAQNYSITVGAGGAAGGAGGGTNGSDSTLSTVTALGGGGGGGNNSDSSSSGVGVAGRTGGSGGGGGSYGAAGARTVNQGYVGGSSSNNGGAGGGGAGAVGSNGSGDNGGAGGNGIAISAFATATSTGVSNYYAGGGAGAANARVAGGSGAAGGSGGGGTSPGYTGSGQVSAVVNTGGGGYGGNGNRGPDSGGSGIVIIRYTMA